MFHSSWLTLLVRLKWYFWEWFTGPAEKSGDKPFHWDLLSLGSNASGSLFQHRMDFSPFLSDKWSAYVRWEIEKNEKPASLRGSIWKLHMQAEDAGKVCCSFCTCSPHVWWKPWVRLGQSGNAAQQKLLIAAKGLSLETLSIICSVRGFADTKLISSITC